MDECCCLSPTTQGRVASTRRVLCVVYGVVCEGVQFFTGQLRRVLRSSFPRALAPRFGASGVEVLPTVPTTAGAGFRRGRRIPRPLCETMIVRLLPPLFSFLRWMRNEQLQSQLCRGGVRPRDVGIWFWRFAQQQTPDHADPEPAQQEEQQNRLGCRWTTRKRRSDVHE